MITQELVNRLTQLIKEMPKEAIKEIEQEPKILEVLLNSAKDANVEKTRYVNMTSDMQQKLQEKSKELKVTQGLLIGAGVLLILSLLEKDNR